MLYCCYCFTFSLGFLRVRSVQNMHLFHYIMFHFVFCTLSQAEYSLMVQNCGLKQQCFIYVLFLHWICIRYCSALYTALYCIVYDVVLLKCIECSKSNTIRSCHYANRTVNTSANLSFRSMGYINTSNN